MKILLYVGISLTVIFSKTTFAATYFVDSKSDISWPDGSAESPVKTIRDGIGLMSSSGGDTLIIRAGTYSDHIKSIVNGTKNKYNIIKAQTDGDVVLTGQFNLPMDSAYLQFEGLKWDSHHPKSIKGHHIKFLRCAFKGGPRKGNDVNVGIGTNDMTPGAHHILIEDSWAYGDGGRYNFLVYNSDSVILRRVIARHDGAWQGGGYDPEAGITIYNSSNVEVQNSIVLDSDLKYQYWESAFYHVKNDSSATQFNNVRVSGSIAVNNPHGNAYGFDGGGNKRNVLVENSVAWKTGGGIAMTGDNQHIMARNLTLGNIKETGAAIWGGKQNQLTLSNSVFYRNKNLPSRINQGKGNLSNNICYPRGKYGCGTNTQSYNPVRNGLKHLPYISKNSRIAKAKAGANIIFKTGVNGSLYGDQGFKHRMKSHLWPWKNENRIKKDLCENTQRGLCATKLTLTQYIWNYIGNTVPASCGITKPYPECLQ